MCILQQKIPCCIIWHLFITNVLCRERKDALDKQNKIVTKIKAAVTKAENAMEAANNQCVNQVSFLFVDSCYISSSSWIGALFDTGVHDIQYLHASVHMQ